MDSKIVSHTAKLACLHLSEEEIELFGRELQAIFKYFDQITHFRAQGLEPLVDPLEGLRSHPSPAREDQVKAFDNPEDLVNLAPDTVGAQYRVPPVVE